MKYLLEGKARCDFLVVGLANPDPTLTAEHQANPHRSRLSSNPFTYYERAIMTRDSLLDAGINWDEITIVPFPINRPELIRYYVPLDATFFMTIFDDWGRAKLKTLQTLNLTVDVMWEGSLSGKCFSSTEIRRRIACGEPWESMVPDAVAHFIKKNGLDERVSRLIVEEQMDILEKR